MSGNKNIAKIIITIIKLICALILVLLIAVLGMQRVSNNKTAIGGFRIFSVATESMVPDYLVGDVIIVKEVDVNELKEQDDVTYLGKVGTFAGRVVTHRIIKIEETAEGKIFHTKGTANQVEDPTITGDQIYGKVVYKTLLFTALTKLMNNLTAFYIIVFIPLGILIFLQIKDRIDEKREEEGDDDDESNTDDSSKNE